MTYSKSISYGGTRYRASSEQGLQILNADGKWETLKPAKKQDVLNIEWFKLKLNPPEK